MTKSDGIDYDGSRNSHYEKHKTYEFENHA